MLERPRRSHAARQRRYRQRERQHEVVVTIVFSPRETAILHRLLALISTSSRTAPPSLMGSISCWPISETCTSSWTWTCDGSLRAAMAAAVSCRT